MANQQSAVTLLNDKQWSLIDGELCLVTGFQPLAGCMDKDGVVTSTGATLPYASITIKCIKVTEEITGYVTHRIDFANLWEAFKESDFDDEHEVLIYWSKKRYKSGIIKLMSAFMPKVIVMICPKGTYESCADFGLSLMKDKKMLVFIHELKSLKWWIPDVIA